MTFWVIPQLHFLVHTLLVTCNQASNFPHVFLTSTVGFYGGKLIEEHALNNIGGATVISSKMVDAFISSLQYSGVQ